MGGITKIGKGIASEASAGTGPKAEAFREFLTKAYSGRWNPETNNWAGAATNPYNAPASEPTQLTWDDYAVRPRSTAWASGI